MRVLKIIKMKIKIVRIAIWSNTNTRQFQLKQLKRQNKVKTSPEESEPMYQFQGQSTRSQYWFDIYIDCIEYNFMTR